jgi:uncharacterized membrane protein/protein-disulfide isomerase
MTKNVRLLLAVLALAGLASALSSLYVHHQLLNRPGYLSFCDVNATVSCTQVYQSRYAYLGGVPVALLGALWYVAVLLVLAGGQWGWASLRDNAPGYVFLLSTAGLGFVLYMAWASLVVLKILCLMCVATYVAVAALFIVSGARTLYPMITIPRRLLQDAKAALASPAALALILVFLAGATAAVAFYPRGGGAAAAAVPEQGQAASADRTSEFVRWWDTQTRMQLPVSADGAAVVIVRFSDFQCPSCAVTYREYKPILARYAAQYPGAIKVVQKEFPLETECNTALARDIHTSSCEAAAASKAAHAKGRGEAMDDWLYANGATLTPASVRQAAGEVGGVTDFDAQYRALINTVKGDIALATILGVKVTPTFYINGVKLEGALPPQYMELALQLELKKAGKTQ